MKDVRKYATYPEMLEHEDAGRIAPGKSREQVLALLKEIYPSKREKLGVVVLEIRTE